MERAASGRLALKPEPVTDISRRIIYIESLPQGQIRPWFVCSENQVQFVPEATQNGYYMYTVP